MTDVRGFTTIYSYDADRRLTGVALSTDERTTFTYDGDTHTTTDALNRVTTTAYDALGNWTGYTYDLRGRAPFILREFSPWPSKRGSRRQSRARPAGPQSDERSENSWTMT